MIPPSIEQQWQGWDGIDNVGYLSSTFCWVPRYLQCRKRIGLIKERADLAWSTLILYIRICVLLYVCSAVYETRTYGAMRGARGAIPYIYSIESFLVDKWVTCQLQNNSSTYRTDVMPFMYGLYAAAHNKSLSIQLVTIPQLFASHTHLFKNFISLGSFSHLRLTTILMRLPLFWVRM